MADQRTPWVGVSQYIKQNRAGLPNEKQFTKVLCTYSCVMPDRDKFHTVIKTHVCNELEKGHEGKCKCLCGFEFQGWE